MNTERRASPSILLLVLSMGLAAMSGVLLSPAEAKETKTLGVVYVTAHGGGAAQGGGGGGSRDGGGGIPTLEEVEVAPDATTLPGVQVWGFRPPSLNWGISNGTVRARSVKIKDKDAEQKDPCEGDGSNPILPSTGNKVEPELDFAVAEEFGLVLQRTYNHYWQGVGLFGRNWTSSFDYKLSFGSTAINSCYPRPGGGACGIGSNTIIYAWRPDGRTIKFIKAADGIFYEDKAKAIAKIVKQADGKFIHYNEEGSREVYSSAGYVEKTINRAGISWTWSYSGGTYPTKVTHSSGRVVTFTWDTTHKQQLRAVTDPAGKAYGFAYEANVFGNGLHRLSASSQPGSPATTIAYHYHSSEKSALAGKSYNGVRYSTFEYDPNGYAISSEHNGADKYTFAYTPGADGLLTVKQTNPLGKQTTYVYKNGKVQTITGHQSANCPETNYALTEYDANGYPAIQESFNGIQTDSYHNAKGQLTKRVEDATGLKRTTTYVWNDATNLLTSETLMGVLKTSYEYNGDGRITKLTRTNLTGVGSAAPLVTTYSYTKHSNGMLKSVAIDGPLAGTGDTITYTYDSSYFLSSIATAVGITTLGGYNALGQPGWTLGANGDRVEYSYDERGRTTRMRQFPNGSAVDTRYTYNAAGLLEKVATPDGKVSQMRYDNNRRLTSSFELEPGNNWSQTRYTYNLMSLPTEVVTDGTDTPAGGVIKGYIDGVLQDAGGTYHIKGWACQTYSNKSIDIHLYLRGPAGSGTMWGSYKANRGSETAVADACGAVGIAYRFDIAVTDDMRNAHGNQPIYIHGISPSGSANSLIAGSGSYKIPANASTAPPPPPEPCEPTRYSGCVPLSVPDGPDLMPRPMTTQAVAISSATGLKRRVKYDEKGRTLEVYGNNGQTVSYQYDGNDNVIKVMETITGTATRTTTFVYDGLNRVISSTDAHQKTTTFSYDIADRITQVIDPKGLVTRYTYDGFGNLIKQVSPDTGTTLFTFNAYGQNTKMTRHDGSVTTYEYDSLGRMTTIAAGSQRQRMGYDWCNNGKGRLCNLDSASGTLHYAYTADGRVTIRREITTANGTKSDYWTRYYYDNVGRLNAINYPNGHTVGYGYVYDKLTAMTLNIGGQVTNLVTDTKYLPYGAVSEFSYGNGLKRNLAYDLDGRLTALTVKNGATVVQSLAYSYNTGNQITRIANSPYPGASQDFVYDNLSRLQSFATGFNDRLSYTFDANGNRTSMVRGGKSNWVDNYAVDAASNRLGGISGKQLLNYVYDKLGNTTMAGATTYSYDGFNRLVGVSKAGVNNTYIVNALGERIFKSAPTHGTYRYVYSGQNQLLAEHKDHGDVWTNYLWFGGQMVGMVRGTQTYFFHNDHLGRPEIVTNTSKTKVWHANNYPDHRSVQYDAVGGVNIALPGQYYDQESGLYYNGFRDFDSNTGRYLQSDPIGLAGGLNTYVYVDGDPVNYIDGDGLQRNPWNRFQRVVKGQNLSPIQVQSIYWQLESQSRDRRLEVMGQNLPLKRAMEEFPVQKIFPDLNTVRCNFVGHCTVEAVTCTCAMEMTCSSEPQFKPMPQDDPGCSCKKSVAPINL